MSSNDCCVFVIPPYEHCSGFFVSISLHFFTRTGSYLFILWNSGCYIKRTLTCHLALAPLFLVHINQTVTIYSLFNILSPPLVIQSFLPILTGKPGGKCSVMKLRSLANKALEIAMRSIIGATCSARERGWDSHNHSLALNLGTHKDINKYLESVNSFHNSDLNFT